MMKFGKAAHGSLPKVGVCAIVRNEADYVEEWVNFHRAQGVSEFRIYDNGSDDGTPDLFRSVGIQVIPCNEIPYRFNKQQLDAYLDGKNYFVGRADWVAYIDIDEFMFGRKGLSLPETLNEFSSDVSAIGVQQRVFGSSFLETKEPGNVIDRFTRCSAPDHAENFWFKSLSRPEHVSDFDTVHSVLLSQGRYALSDGGELPRSPNNHAGLCDRLAADGKIGLHHYMVKSREEFRKKAQRWADRSEGPRRKEENYFKNRLERCNTHVNTELCGFLTSPPFHESSAIIQGQVTQRSGWRDRLIDFIQVRRSM